MGVSFHTEATPDSHGCVTERPIIHFIILLCMHDTYCLLFMYSTVLLMIFVIAC